MSKPIITDDADLSPMEKALLAGAARAAVVDLEGGAVRGGALRALLNGNRPE